MRTCSSSHGTLAAIPSPGSSSSIGSRWYVDASIGQRDSTADPNRNDGSGHSDGSNGAPPKACW